uniref:ETS domain-containing protein n=1 Tax=Parascaris univalens TaxID=6257 RepID=A0A915A633_PARUN
MVFGHFSLNELNVTISQMTSTVNSDKVTALKDNDSMPKCCCPLDFGEATGVTSVDSGVSIDGSNEIEAVTQELETELDLSRILSDLSPIRPFTRNFQPLQCKETQACNSQHNDNESHEGSENESVAISSSGDDDEESKQNNDGEVNRVSVDLPSPPFLESSPSCNVPYDISKSGLNPVITFPPLDFLPSSCSYYGSQMPINYAVGPPKGDSVHSMFSSPSFNTSATQDLQSIHHNGESSVTRREPNNDERIAFLKGCSSAPLWQFVLDCLSQPTRFNNICLWTKNVWEFCIMQTKKFAERWDEYNCNKVTTSYVKVARALKSYENTQFCGLTLLGRVSSRRNTFRFLPDHDSPLIPLIHYEPPTSLPSAGRLAPQQRSFAHPGTLFAPAEADCRDFILNNCYTPFELSAQPRTPAKRPLEFYPFEMHQEAAQRIKNPRIDEGHLQFPSQMQNVTASTPLRDVPAPMMFEQEVTNAFQLRQQPPSFSQTSFYPAACSSNPWMNQDQFVHHSNTPFWGHPGGTLSYQLSESNIQNYTYGGYNERTPFDSANARYSIGTNENNVNCNSFGSSSSDSAFYDDIQPTQLYSDPPNCIPLASSANRVEEMVSENAQTRFLYNDGGIYR